MKWCFGKFSIVNLKTVLNDCVGRFLKQVVLSEAKLIYLYSFIFF